MKLTTGYKQTEIGVIPEDWDVKRLGDLFDFKNGLNKEKQYFGTGTPIVNYMDVFKNCGLAAKDIKGKVTVTPAEMNNYNARKGDVFFTRTSETVEEIGIASVITEDLINTVFSGFILRARTKNDLLDINYKKYCFSAKSVRKEITSKSSYTTRALTNGRLLSEVKIPVPPPPEQKAIAETLSDVDALVSALDALISKKRDIKQGAMQTLLTGSQRLPGFSGDWETKKLGDAAQIIMGQSPSSAFYNNRKLGLPLIQGNADIECRKTIARIYTSQITKKCFIGDIIMSVRAPVGEISKATFDACLGRGVCAIRYKNEYLFHYLIFSENAWSKLSKGSTFDSVNSKEVKEFEILLPPTPEEQKAIAEVLSEMDAEIEALERKRDKYKALKQGMMQELLTGKTRIVKPQTAIDGEPAKAARLETLGELTAQAQELKMGY